MFLLKFNFSKNLQGVLWKLLSCAIFAISNVLIKYLSGGSNIMIETTLPTYMIAFFKHLFAFIIIIPFIDIKKLNLLKSKNPKLNIIRILAAALGLNVIYLSYKLLPLAQVVALSFLGPIFTVLVAIIFLKEKLSLTKSIAIILSFLGTILIIQSDIKSLTEIINYNLYILLPIAAALVFVISKITTRKLTIQGESAQNLTLYLIAFVAPASLLPLLFLPWVSPTLYQIPYLIILGILTILGQYCFSKAYSLAEVTILTPVSFAKIILTCIAGFLAFGEFPTNIITWVGIFIIATSVIIISKKPTKNLINKK